MVLHQTHWVVAITDMGTLMDTWREEEGREGGTGGGREEGRGGGEGRKGGRGGRGGGGRKGGEERR